MRLKGIAEWGAAMDGLITGADAAVRKSVSQGALLQKRAVRANMEGPPRWVDHVNHPRGGPVGKLTGRLQKSVSYSPIQRLGYGHYRTYLKAKRVYAIKDEAKYPYFQGPVRASEPAVQAVFVRNYAQVLARA